MYMVDFPWMINPDGSVTLTIPLSQRRISTFLDYKLVPRSAPIISAHGFFRGYNSSTQAQAAWDSTGWVRIGQTPTSCNPTPNSYTITIPAQTEPMILFLREGVWRHSGDEAWVTANGGTGGSAITCSNTYSEWYTEAGADQFYIPMRTWQWGNPSTFSGSMQRLTGDAVWNKQWPQTIFGNMGGQWEEIGAGWLDSDQATDASAVETKFRPRSSRGSWVSFRVAGSTDSSVANHRWVLFVPYRTPGTFSTNKSFSSLVNGETATISIQFPDARQAMYLALGENYGREYGLSAPAVVSPSLFSCVGGTLSNIRIPKIYEPATEDDPESWSPSNTWTATFTPTPNYSGQASISFAPVELAEALRLTYAYSESYGLAGSFSGTIGQNASVPVVSIASSRSKLAASQRAELTFTLSTAATDFTSSDVVVQNATLSSFRGGPQSWTATLTPKANFAGNCVVTVPANAVTAQWGVKNAATTLSIPADTSTPSITLASKTSTLLSGQTANISFSLSEPLPSFSLNAVSVSGGTLSQLAGNGTSYSAVFTPAAAFFGSASLTIAAGAVSDAAGNPCKQSRPLSLQVRSLSPTVSISSTARTLGGTQTAQVSFELSVDASNFVQSDVTVAGGTLSRWSRAGRRYTATFTPAANSTTAGQISVAAGAFTDRDGNASLAGSLSPAIQVDTRPLTFSIARPADEPASILSNGVETARLEITPNKPNVSLRASHVTVPRGSISAMTWTGEKFTCQYKPPRGFSGSVAVEIRAGVISDAFGNRNTAAALASPVVCSAS